MDYVARLWLAADRRRWFFHHLLDFAIVTLPLRSANYDKSYRQEAECSRDLGSHDDYRAGNVHHQRCRWHAHRGRPTGRSTAAAVVFLHGGGQTRRWWGKAAAAVAERGWQAVTVDLRGHGESDWSEGGDYRLTSFAARHPGSAASRTAATGVGGRIARRIHDNASGGELSPGIARAVVLVDIVPNMDPSGANRIHNFMADRMKSGFESLDEVADAIAEYNPDRPRPVDLDGLAQTRAAAEIAGTGTGTRSSSATPRRCRPRGGRRRSAERRG